MGADIWGVCMKPQSMEGPEARHDPRAPARAQSATSRSRLLDAIVQIYIDSLHTVVENSLIIKHTLGSRYVIMLAVWLPRGACQPAALWVSCSNHIINTCYFHILTAARHVRLSAYIVTSTIHILHETVFPKLALVTLRLRCKRVHIMLKYYNDTKSQYQ